MIMKHEYYIGETQVSFAKFLKTKDSLDMSNLDWEIDYDNNRTTIYILG